MTYAIIQVGIGKMQECNSNDEVVAMFKSMLEIIRKDEMGDWIVVTYGCNCFACNGKPIAYSVDLDNLRLWEMGTPSPSLLREAKSLPIPERG